MLPKEHRLNQEQDINRVMRTGKRVSCAYFLLACILFSENKQKRFGFLVSKKVSGKTTQRNLVKRRMRQIVSKQLKLCRPGIACVFIARQKILEAGYAALEEQMEHKLRSLGILKSHP